MLAQAQVCAEGISPPDRIAGFDSIKGMAISALPEARLADRDGYACLP